VGLPVLFLAHPISDGALFALMYLASL